MSKRYSRLYSLPNNLYTEGSPLLIAAGALLKDDQTGSVLAQLKFLNITEENIKAVKIKINAYDAAGGQLEGIEAFSYLDLSVETNSFFGQNTPVYLKDATTRSFSVEILSVVYGDKKVFSPDTPCIASIAPASILEKANQIADAHNLLKSKKDNASKISKISKNLYIVSSISIVFIILSALSSFSRHGDWALIQVITALLTPGICLFTAAFIKKNLAILKPASIACVVLFVLKIACIVCCAITPMNSLRDINLAYRISQFVNGGDLMYCIQYLNDGSGILSSYSTINGPAISVILPSIFALLPNILCSISMLINSKKATKTA